MNDGNKGGGERRNSIRGRKPRNTFVTKSGKTITIHRNISERIKASRDAAAQRKAIRLAGLPKSRVKRFFYHFHPVRVYKYWFSREGALMALKLTGIGIITGFLVLVGVFAYFRKDLPNLKDISGTNLGGSIRYYDRSGQTLLWEDFDGVKRTVVSDETISQNIKDAAVAIEDKDFFKHGGFDMKGITRAALNDLVGKGGTQGGSTITQQLVKLNNDWTHDRTITRKIKELILSVELERTYSKKEILAGYLNTAPFGNVQYGVEAAAQDYFQKSAKDISVDEAAFLVAIPKSPSYYSPYGPLYKEDPLAAEADLRGRQKYIIGLMHEQGMITKQEYDEAIKSDTLARIHEPKARYNNISAPWFVLTAKEELEAKYGAKTVKRGGWKVTTTVDLKLQKLAEEQVQKGLAQVKRQGGDQVGFVAEDVTTGQVVALVGGVDFKNEEFGQNNYARLKIPPGSSIKPYDYVSLIDNTTTFGAGSVLYDTKGVLPGYPCTTGVTRTGNCAIDYDLRYPGPLTLRYALGGSRNVPAMKAMLLQDTDPETSVNKTLSTIKKLMQSPGTPAGEARGTYACYKPGDDTLTITAQCGAAAAIGDGAYLKLDEHVHGYATLSRNGFNIPQTYILKIEDSASKEVPLQSGKGAQTVRAESAYIVDDILADPNASYLASKPHRYNGWKFGFKTGTTNDSKDGLMMGMSTKYAAGVWVGYHNRTREMTGFMENMTQPIVTGWMKSAHDGITPVERERPSGIQTLPAFVVTSHVGASSREPSPSTDLFPSWYKQPAKTGSSKQTIDIVSNKLATDCTPSRARKDVTQTNASSFSGDRFVTGASANTGQQDDIHKCDDAKPTIQIMSATSSSITVVVTGGTHALSSSQFAGAINIVIDGQTVQSFPVDNNQNGSPITLNFNYTGSGSKAITAQVVDSVLYDASDDSDAITFVGASTMSITSPGSSTSSSTTTVEWSGGTAPFSVSLDGDAVCSNTPTNSCSINTPGHNKDYTVIVTDSTGAKATKTFQKD